MDVFPDMVRLPWEARLIRLDHLQKMFAMQKLWIDKRYDPMDATSLSNAKHEKNLQKKNLEK
jgi:hypothetical protein